MEMVMNRCVMALLAGATMAAAAACGNSTSSGGGGDESSKTADQIMLDSVAALRQAHVAHLYGHTTIGGESATIDGIVEQDSSRITVTTSSMVIILIVSGGQAYGIQGGQAVQLSGDSATEIKAFTIAKAADCAGREHGALSKGATSTINGKRVIAIMDDGHAPGASTSTTYVALDGPPLVIRTVSTSATTPGGSLDCGHGSSSTSSTSSGSEGQTVDWDYPTDVPVITAPPGAVPV
jgi:hypothetical protein